MITSYNTDPTLEEQPVYQDAAGMAAGALPPEPTPSPNYLLDIAAAPFRGAVGAVDSTYQLADALTGDALPDYDLNFLGHSETAAGSVVEGISQFLIPFAVPGVGALALAGKATQAVGLAGKAATVAKAALAGAAVDFTAFKGHEERLSNLIEKHPSLSNPITEYLAADKDDGEIEGRFKAALEGLGIGAVTDGLGRALRAVKAHRAWAITGAIEDGAKREGIVADLKKKIADAENVANKTLDEIRGEHKTLSDGTAGVEVVEEKAKAPLPPEAKIEEGQRALAEKIANANLVDLAKTEGPELFQHTPYGEGGKDMGRLFGKDSIVSAVNGPADLVNLMRFTSEAMQKAGYKTPVESLGERFGKSEEVISDLFGLPVDSVERTFRGRLEQFAGGGYNADAALKVTMALAQDVSASATMLRQGRIPEGITRDQLLVRVLRGQQHLSTMMTIAKGYGTVAGRVLRARRTIAKEFLESATAAKQLVAELGGEDFALSEVNKLGVLVEANKDNPYDALAGVLKASTGQSSFGDRLFRLHNEYWLNAILSGSKTSLVNLIGNTVTTAYLPLERAVGSLVRGDRSAAAASLRSYIYLKENLGDAWKFAKQAYLSEDSVLFGKNKTVLDPVNAGAPAWDAGQFGGAATQGYTAEAKAMTSGDGNMLSHLFNFIGENVRIPQRFLMAQDEFFKQINYRAAAKSNLYYQGVKQGLDGEELAKFIGDRLSLTVTEGGRKFSEGAVYREVIEEADKLGMTGRRRATWIEQQVKSRYDPTKSALADTFGADGYGGANAFAEATAEEATFTADLGKMGKGLQQFAASHPAFQLILPFVKTPTNIVKFFGQRGASGMLAVPGLDRLQAKNLSELASHDPMVRSAAAGRLAMGNLFVSMAGSLALAGKITGTGPTDEKERAQLMQTGWQPRSIVIETAEGPVYYSYDRLDPFATFLGLTADWYELAKRQDPHHAGAASSMIGALTTAFTENITNKSYMQSLAKFIDFVQDPERRAASWTKSRAASYVPSILAQFSNVTESGSTLRELRTPFDAILNRIPGAGGGLEPKRNIVGEPIDTMLAQTPAAWVNPVTVSRDRNDKVFAELATFGHAIQPPSNIYLGKIDLLDDAYRGADGRTAYDMWQERIGQVKIEGRTMRQMLERLMSSKEYKALPGSDQTGIYDSPRLSAIKRVIYAYRQTAMAQLQRDNPNVLEAVMRYHQDRLDIASGRAATNLERFTAAAN